MARGDTGGDFHLLGGGEKTEAAGDSTGGGDWQRKKEDRERRESRGIGCGTVQDAGQKEEKEIVTKGLGGASECKRL